MAIRASLPAVLVLGVLAACGEDVSDPPAAAPVAIERAEIEHVLASLSCAIEAYLGAMAARRSDVRIASVSAKATLDIGAMRSTSAEAAASLLAESGAGTMQLSDRRRLSQSVTVSFGIEIDDHADAGSPNEACARALEQVDGSLLTSTLASVHDRVGTAHETTILHPQRFTFASAFAVQEKHEGAFDIRLKEADAGIALDADEASGLDHAHGVEITIEFASPRRR